MEREQFTFYSSFARAVKRIRKAADRAAAYDAIVDYALSGIEPDMEKMPDTAAIAFELVRPNLDASRRKAENGKNGGRPKAKGKQTDSSEDFASADGESKQNQSENKPKANETEPKANGKQEQTEPKANRKQEQTANKKEKEKEKEGEKENECSISLPEEKLKEAPSPLPAEKKQSESKPAPRLTEKEYAALLELPPGKLMDRIQGYPEEWKAKILRDRYDLKFGGKT